MRLCGTGDDVCEFRGQQASPASLNSPWTRSAVVRVCRTLAALDGQARHQGGAAEGEHHLFAFLTCEPNAVVALVHPKAMPVILTTPEEGVR